jgi:hypothetical protein
MSIEIVKLRHYNENASSIDIAFPVLAFECEAYVPQDNELDAYQEAVLKLVSIGLAENGVKNTLDISQSLCGDIFNSLSANNYLGRTNNKWELTERGIKALNDEKAIEISNTSKFGYMFLSAIKRDPFQYFYEGDIHNIPLSDPSLLGKELTIAKDEHKTFNNNAVSKWCIEKAYSSYCKIVKTLEKKEKGSIDEDEVEALFTEIESDFSEVEYAEPNQQQSEDELFEHNGEENENFRMRRLKRESVKYYLQMRIVFDPSLPGGYMVESPLDFGGYDNDFFLRQIQWMENPSQNIYMGQKKLCDVIRNEINKLSVNPINKVNFNVFMLKKFPELESRKEKYNRLYRDVQDVFSLISKNNLSQFDRENIVGGLNRKVLEYLFNKMIRTIPEEKRQQVEKRAYYEYKNDETIMIQKYLKVVKLNRGIFQDHLSFKGAINHIDNTMGNSILEKFLNLILLRYYQPSKGILFFFEETEINSFCEKILKMNSIRNLISHDSDMSMSKEDYAYYIDNIFTLANILLQTLEEAN